MCLLECIAQGLQDLANLLRPKTVVHWKIGPVTEATGVSRPGTGLIRIRKRMADIMLVLKDTEQSALATQFLDKKGNPAPVQGVPVWATSDATILSVTPEADGLSATIVANGPLGTAQVSVTADADLGDGVKPVVGTLDVNIVAGEAVSANISAGTPTEQP